MTVHEQSSNIDQEGSRDLRYKLLLAGQVFAEGQLASLNATFGNLDGRNMLSEGEGAPNAHAHFLKHIASVFEKRVDPGEQIELLAPDGALLLAGVIPGPSDVRWQAAGKPQRLLLVSPEDGIYLGCCMGLGFARKCSFALASSCIHCVNSGEGFCGLTRAHSHNPTLSCFHFSTCPRVFGPATPSGTPMEASPFTVRMYS